MLKIIDGELNNKKYSFEYSYNFVILIVGNGQALQQQHQLHFTFICIHFITLCLRQSKFFLWFYNLKIMITLLITTILPIYYLR